MGNQGFQILYINFATTIVKGRSTMRKIVICPDSFKGSLTAQEVADTIAASIKSVLPGMELIKLPLADGGEGTAKVLSKIYPSRKEIMVSDPLGRKIKSCYYISHTGEKALIESADVIGLNLMKQEERNPLSAATFGLGELIKEIIDNGIKDITISLGGSATCDGGEGIKQIFDKYNLWKSLCDINFTIICDVENPLLGSNGAAAIFSPQKGALPEQIPILEERLKQIAIEAVEKGLCLPSQINYAGGGAAGGLGFFFHTFLKATMIRGIDYILETLKFSDKIKGSDLIITGEGKIDSQSLMGKVIEGVVKQAKVYKIPVIAMSGLVEDKEKLYSLGLREIIEISKKELSLEENMKKEVAKRNLKDAVNKNLLDLIKNTQE